MAQAEEGLEQMEEEQSRTPLRETPSRRNRLFTKQLRAMMYGFGDDQNPYIESVDLLEDLVLKYITEMTHMAMDRHGSKRIQAEDVIYLVRKDTRKYERVKELFRANEKIKKARKLLNEDIVPDLTK